MSERARLVIRAIDQAEHTRARHPTLFAAQLHAPGLDRTCLHLARAVERYKREKPSPHVRPDRDEVERVDPAFEETQAERNRTRWERNRLKFDARRREQLATMGTRTLILQAFIEAEEMSTVAAGNVEPSRGGENPGGVPTQQLVTDDPRWDLADRIIRRQALVLHELIAEAKGLSHANAIAAMTGVEKDRIIIDEGRGLIAEHVVEALGREYGSATYVRRLRKERGLDTRGYEKTDS